MWLTDHIDAVLNIALIASVVTCAAWVVLTFSERQRRRALNLTTAETAAGSIRPDFLSVDRAKREATIARGRNLEASRRPEVAAGSGASLLSRWLALGTALASFVAAATGAVQKAGTVQELYGKTGFFWVHFGEILQRYWIGFAFASLVILGNLAILLYRIFDGGKN
jgi:hypothetical protein